MGEGISISFSAAVSGFFFELNHTSSFHKSKSPGNRQSRASKTEHTASIQLTYTQA
jgi:hypothetical protein